jgi:hypothetical protein
MSQDMIVNWPAIDPEDVDVLEFDFRLYAGSASLLAVSMVVEVQRGLHATPQSILLGAAVLNGAVAFQRVSNCASGVIYRVRARGSFSDGRAQVLAGSLPCVRR